MNIDLSSKPQIVIELNPVLEAYCRYIFGSFKQNEIIVTRRHPVGKRIVSISDECSFLKKVPCINNSVVFVLPINKVNHYHVKRRFLKIKPWEKQNLVDFIDSEFNLWVREEFYRGYEILEWNQKTIAEVICRKIDVRNNAVNLATIIKNDYRNRVYVDKMKIKLLESF